MKRIRYLMSLIVVFVLGMIGVVFITNSLLIEFEALQFIFKGVCGFVYCAAFFNLIKDERNEDQAFDRHPN